MKPITTSTAQILGLIPITLWDKHQAHLQSQWGYVSWERWLALEQQRIGDAHIVQGEDGKLALFVEARPKPSDKEVTHEYQS